MATTTKKKCEHKVLLVVDLPPTGNEFRRSMRSWLEICKVCGKQKTKKAPFRHWRHWTLDAPGWW